jgi:hypothetical protein
MGMWESQKWSAPDLQPVAERPRCGTCRYADPAVIGNVDGDGPDAVLLCHRYPPTMIPDDDDAVGPVWPLVESTGWCGEHIPRPETP